MNSKVSICGRNSLIILLSALFMVSLLPVISGKEGV